MSHSQCSTTELNSFSPHTIQLNFTASHFITLSLQCLYIGPGVASAAHGKCDAAHGKCDAAHGKCDAGYGKPDAQTYSSTGCRCRVRDARWTEVTIDIVISSLAATTWPTRVGNFNIMQFSGVLSVDYMLLLK